MVDVRIGPRTEQVLRRLDGVLALLPQAQKQAHERIIGQRRVDNADKVLSLYETDTRGLCAPVPKTQCG